MHTEADRIMKQMEEADVVVEAQVTLTVRLSSNQPSRREHGVDA